MKKILSVIKKEPMLFASVAAAVAALFITPPSKALLRDIDWKTLVTLFMMLTVLEGFKKENIFRPLLKFSGKLGTMVSLTFFIVGGVFFSSMFVTNDVSLIVFVPLTIILFRAGDKEKYILPVISMENIAAVRGSLLTPFGSPQNLFIFGQSGMSVGTFLRVMLPLWIMSAFLLSAFIIFLYRKDEKEKISLTGSGVEGVWLPERKKQRVVYLVLFALILITIVTRTEYWLVTAAVVLVSVLIADRKTLVKTDYVLLLTFFCFFVFSSSVSANPSVSAFLSESVNGREYVWSILLSQVISNVPASIVLYPFTGNVRALLYGLDTAGLCTVIGSLASVINLRLYVREYPGGSGRFIKVFTLVSLAFFAFVALPGYFIGKLPV